ncbi:TauD/TfdA family dioxygenase [Nocardia sp. NBC_01327]|uniref:TauD/TfdA family dioxygenase n=1 Tax=Nocardia sp. NBC_01327 TaxID=2903593 RepID=UPI002E139753|nr:TauD/TfdA family dioxygenase [Nocardia sp. NBC_01327]
MANMIEISEEASCGAGWRDEFRTKLDRCGFVIIEPGDANDVKFDELMSELGDPVVYGFGTKLSLEPQEGSDNLQFTTRGMPLHADSTFNAGPAVKYIGMQCVRAPEVGGETLIASAAAFFANAPADLIDTMQNIVVEYRNRIDGYYKDRSVGDHPRVDPIQVDPESGEKRIVMGFTDPDDPMRTHDAMVVGYSAEESAKLLRRIEAMLHLPSVLYAHKWRVGEIVILDNTRVLHGRGAFPNQARKLIRLSVG